MWQPITRSEFDALFDEQQTQLSPDERQAFDQYRVPLQTAGIRRSKMYGIERVHVVARSGPGVLYFDDVEYGFNVSEVDSQNIILQPGGSQFTLSEAVRAWIMGAAGQ